MRSFDAPFVGRLACVLSLSGLLLAPAAYAADAPAAPASLHAAITGGKANLDMRLRYEGVDQDNALDNADALTLRSRLGYTTGAYQGFSAMLEYEGIADFSGDAYNSTLNGVTDRSVVPDPEGDELNQAFLQYAGLPSTTIKLGRQRLILDNARFIGNVGWRQNEQTFDGATLITKAIPRTTLTYAYLTRANRIVFNDFDMDGHLLNATVKPIEVLSLSGYAYLTDYDPGAPTPPADSQTLGARAQLALTSPFKPTFALEVARQSDYADAPSTVDADYLFGSAAATFGPVTAMLAYEVLGGDGTYAFQTPLATLHAFQGWADLFLTTPVNGIEDSYLQLSGAVAKVKLMGAYHDFKSDHDSIDYGTEIDLQAAYAVTKTLTGTLKYADYSADDFAVDTTKLWAMLEYKF